jgi:pseudomonalisin
MLKDRLTRGFSFALAAVVTLLTGVALAAPGAATAAPIAINDNDRVVLGGNVHPLARAEFEIGHTDALLPMEKMILLLALRPGAQAQLDQLHADLQNPASPRYHQWLTPEEYGARFGLADADLAMVTGWLQDHGFTVDEVAKGRNWINFSGTAAQVERAFATEMRDYQVEGVVRHANSIDPSIPRALAGVVKGVVTLHSFPRPWHHGAVRPVTADEIRPDFTSGTSHFLAPADFAIIYDLNSLYSAGITGSGQTIAIVARTDIATADYTFFRSFFGLPATSLTVVHNGTDPGDLGGGEETEADLDVEWSGAVAQGATIKQVVSMSTNTTDGVDLSAQYIVNNNVGSAMSTSFGQCESQMGSTELAFYNTIWSQGASEGITAFVSAGDAGAAGCNAGSDTTGSGQAVSGLSSTPFNVCVGGTEFMDTSNPSLYWATTNNGTTEASALSYIPEMAWNESGTVSGGANLWSTGGGASNTYAKPSWQVATGVPADGKRDVPDVSFTAAGHDGYIIVQGHTTGTTGLASVGGTSASSPSWAGMMGLINQKTGARQGNANTVLYPMAANQYNGTGPVVFHDITVGNNSVPGTTGFNCTTGYDQATGLGSVDGAALANNWGATANPDFAISASPSSTSIVQGSAGNVTVTTTVSGGFNAAVALSASGQPTGVTVGFSPTSIAAPGAGSSTMSITVASTTATGTYSIVVTGTGGGKTHTTTVSLTVTAAPVPDFTISASPSSTSIVQGSAGNVTVTTTISGGFNAAVALSASGQPTGVTVGFSPTSIAAPGAGSSTMSITVASTTATGTYSIVVTGTGGGKTHTTTVTLTVTAVPVPDFTIAASPTSISIAQGSAGNVTITTTVSGGFNSAVALSASGQPTGVTVAFNPTSIAAPGAGTSTMTITVAATAATGTSTIVVTGTGGGKTHTANVGLTVTTSAPQQLLLNPGFESGSVNWVATPAVIGQNGPAEPAHSGTWDAWLDGYGINHTDTLYQQVTIPSTITTATLTFWLHIDTAETTKTTAFDTLNVQVRNSSNTVLATLATFSNLNKNTGYALHTYDLSAYKGQTIRVYLIGVEDSSLQTSFVVDDFALNVQ